MTKEKHYGYEDGLEQEENENGSVKKQIQKQQKQSKMKFIFNTIKDNILYIIMFSAVILAILFSNGYVSYSNEEGDEGASEEIKKRKFPLQIFLIVTAVLIFFIYSMVSGSKGYMQKAKNEFETPKKSYVERISKAEYEKITQETTKKELVKLMQSPQFKQMKQQKGEDPKNWVWQTREKEKKVVYREREDSDEDDHLSQLTVSDD